jgi:hypothetical protein
VNFVLAPRGSYGWDIEGIPSGKGQPVQCHAKRGPKSKTLCEEPALHNQGCLPFVGARWHCGRSPAGRWFSWRD